MRGDVMRDTQPAKGKEGKRGKKEKKRAKESESVPLLYPMKDRGVYSEILYHIKERVYV